MNTFLRRPTRTTPYVNLDSKSGVYMVAGRSIPIDAELFYRPVINWLDQLCASPPESLSFTFRLEFFNIASSKRILFILYKLSEIQSKGCEVTVQWMYEKQDDDTLEIGQDYAQMIDDLHFVFEEYNPAKLDKRYMIEAE
jgi:hypothetical protein